jgi:hypothetical protein
VPPAGHASACANALGVSHRSPGCFANAFCTAVSSHAGTSARFSVNGTIGSVNSCAMIACAVGPVNGAAPPSISYSIAPSE